MKIKNQGAYFNGRIAVSKTADVGSIPAAPAIFFSIICGLLYIAIIITGIFSQNGVASTVLKLSGISLCFLFILITNHKNHHLVLAALFTLIADLFLAGESPLTTLGVFTFIFAQYYHTKNLYGLKKSTPPHILNFVPVLAFFALCLSELIRLPLFANLLLGIIYAFVLFQNLSYSYINRKKSKQFFLIFLGFTLFALCDFHVFFSAASGAHYLPISLRPFFDYFAWVYYFPSQVILAISARSMIK